MCIRREILPTAILVIIVQASAALAAASQELAKFKGKCGPGAGRHIVLVSGDEEYRSEESLPLLAKILSRHHGFDCTVLFAIDPESGIVNPNVCNNIAGLESLDTADLMILFTRRRILPDEQMDCIDRYLKTGKPVVGMRTATHAFAMPDAILEKVKAYKQTNSQAGSEKESEPDLMVGAKDWGTFGHYSDGYFGPRKMWKGGFGRFVLGEGWIAHHGHHKRESTRGIVAECAQGHPIARGIKDGDVWGPSDVYQVRLPLPGDSQPIFLGQVISRGGEFDEKDAFYGMRPTDSLEVAEKNRPTMPIAWTKTYQIPGGEAGRVFMTTMGASTDLVSEGTRRMLVNGIFWAIGLEKDILEDGLNVDIVGSFEPTKFKFHPLEYWLGLKLKPADFSDSRE